MTDKEAELDFSLLLASSIHDMKNSLAMLLGSLSEITSQCSPSSCKQYQDLIRIQSQGKRVNHDLIQLLTLYRINNNQYCLNINEHPVQAYLEEILLENQEYLSHCDIEIALDCDDSLYGYFDGELLRGVINTIINNAHQYTRNKIMLAAKMEDGFLRISVIDNGPGYPKEMLENSAGAEGGKRAVNFSTGSTGLGLYFAGTVARIHKNGANSGYISLANDEKTGGGRFSIYLP